MSDGFLSSLACFVEEAVHADPPDELRAVCGDRYRPYYYLMYLLAGSIGHLLPIGMCVELGVEKGRGSAAMALSGWPVFGVDHTRKGEIAVMQRRFPRFCFLEQPSTPVPDTIKDRFDIDWRIPLLHVDTGHSYGQAREEWEHYEPLLADRAVVLFDDTHAMADDVARFVVSLKHPMIFDERLHECGYAVVAYERGKT